MNSKRRRPPFENVGSKKFAVLYKGQVYIFKNENSTNHVKETSFSLYGFKSVQLPILEENEVLWVFKLVHADPAKSKCFATSSEIELQVRIYLLVRSRQSYANWPDRTSSQLDIYDGVRRSQEGGRYMYEGLSVHNGQSLTQSYSQMNIDCSNMGSDVYEVVNRQSNASKERPPMLPPRPKKENKTPNNYLESSSEFEDDDGDDSSEGYCIYENTNDVHYYNVSSETSDFIGEAKIELSKESRYSVISVKPYKAMTSDELDFPKEKNLKSLAKKLSGGLSEKLVERKDFFLLSMLRIISDNETLTQDLTVYSVIAIQSYKGKSYDEISFRKEDKFNVVGQESERWLVGEVNGNRGLFPAEYVKKCQIVSSKTSNKTKRRETKDSTRQSKYCVIATKSYSAKNLSQISFQKEDKFIVVGEKSSGWLIGEIHGKKGLFPSEYVKVCTPLSRQKQMFEWMLSA
ncbi:unnamed protein product [Mytilus edulis]|uniref:SH3 domain-containing protein n=1 Tax=Mytilus edulis TaxID=6550 RepID=A0A8S3QYM6_MYTED|nr:unnamed protein product [Mytilus edulis]